MLSVIAYHIDHTLLPGGFVGVDIFFVISGYLISLQILGEIRKGSFSLGEFYRRRIKRIAPAMLTVVAVTLVATQLLFIPADAETASEAALFAILSLANIYFWKFADASYFAPAAEEQPFLHLWSLGVEEQFYFVWPLAVLALYKASATAQFAIGCVVVAGISFALGDLLFARDPSFVYYMLPTRAGELLLGALVAQATIDGLPERTTKRLTQGLGLFGLAIMAWALVATSALAPFPGWRAIPPTLGTALVIFSGTAHETIVSAALRWRALTLVGVISYSAYLWHWPILAVPRYFGVDFGPALGVIALAATMLLAWATYRYIETPARQTTLPLKQVALRQFAAPAGVLLAVSVFGKLTEGLGPRLLIPSLEQQVVAADLETRAAFESPYICQRWVVTEELLENPECVVGTETTTEPPVILWGDSNASHYVGMLGAIARAEGYAFRNVAASGCPPLGKDLDRILPAHKLRDCTASARAVLPRLHTYRTVWISADWLTYSRRSDDFWAILADSVQDLTTRGVRVVLIGNAPAIPRYDRRCKQKAILMPLLTCAYPDTPLSAEVTQVNDRLAAIVAGKPGTAYFDASSYLCPNSVCPLTDESGKLIFFDGRHLSLDASWRLGARILRDGVPPTFRRDETVGLLATLRAKPQGIQGKDR